MVFPNPAFGVLRDRGMVSGKQKKRKKRDTHDFLIQYASTIKIKHQARGKAGHTTKKFLWLPAGQYNSSSYKLVAAAVSKYRQNDKTPSSKKSNILKDSTFPGYFTRTYFVWMNRWRSPWNIYFSEKYKNSSSFFFESHGRTDVARSGHGDWENKWPKRPDQPDLDKL